MGFFGSYGKQKAKDAQSGIIKFLINWDPQGATEAQILEMRSKLTEISEKAAKAQQIFKKEKLEADNIKKLYNERVSAAELLKEKLEKEPSPSLEKSLDKLISSIEKMVPDMEAEIQEAVEAEEYFKYLEQVTVEAAEKLKTARSELNTAMRKMDKAKLQEEMAKDKEEAAAIGAGVSSNDFSTAIGAIHNITQEAEARGEAARKRTELLKPVHVEEDENIAEALERVKGVQKPGDIKERLANLKKVAV